MRIILAEDSALLRQGLTMVLGALGHSVLAEVEDAPSLLTAVEAAMAGEGVDAVITDVRMPPTHTSDGLKAALQLRETYPGLPIVVLSQYITTAYARELFARSAAGLGYLLKDRVGDVEEFARALDTVVAGGTVIDPDVVQHLLGGTSSSGQTAGQVRGALPGTAADTSGADAPAPFPSPGAGTAGGASARQLGQAAHPTEGKLARLSPRELEILRLMAQGRSNAEIEAELFISPATVAKHVGNIFDKLDLPADTGNRRVRAVLAFLEG
ncbi:MAG: response regulator transcription factor [Rothia sp. (in: high G+C Gram-positive bacteria)]|uniref:response regulator transcription factor n=1 Tax=Rothia sp. (in: high G+C Gram-positive bacteria) TaxID=1885016 RepID=UPI0026F601F0|nr:response regulator transcription factor [Rothia sp. (in: high G+C Gram-positive bacteria)]